MKTKNHLIGKQITIILILLLNFQPKLSYGQFLDALGAAKISVTIKHAPKLGLKVDKVIFNPSGTQPCKDRVLSEMVSGFVRNGADVIERDQLNALLDEQKFSQSNSVDQTMALKMGKITGASTMISMKVLKCKVTQVNNLFKDVNKYAKNGSRYVERVYIARTTVNLEVSIQTTDLTTGIIFQAHPFTYSPVKEYSSAAGIPELPSEDEVYTEAYNNLYSDVNKLYFAWSEYVTLYFFDDKVNGIKDAYNALKTNSTEQAFELSKQALNNCKTNPETKDKHLAHANYNLGICYMIKSQYDSALTYLYEAQKLRAGQIVNDAISKCTTAKIENASLRSIVMKSELSQQKEEETQQQQQNKIESKTLTNESIIALSKKNISINIIKSKIEKSICKFDTSENGLDQLNKAGIKEDIILLMISKSEN